MNQEFLQKFIETNQPLTDKTIDQAVVNSKNGSTQPPWAVSAVL